MRCSYGDETWGVFSALTHRNLQIAEENGRLCLKISEEDFEFQMRRYNQILQNLLEDIRRPCEKKKELAKRLHVSQSLLSAATSEKNERKLKRDVILSALLSLSVLPTVDQVNHKLMELAEPGLFTQTAYTEENRRNWVLHHILEHGQDYACPMESWLLYANTALELLDLPPLICQDTGGVFPEADRAMLEDWREQIAQIGFVDFSVMRRQLLLDYRIRNRLDDYGGRKKTFDKLSRESGVDVSMVESVFGTMTNRNSDVNPETLIPVMAVMGCSLYQVNEMLLQANRELVYTTSRTAYALKWIGRLVSNSRA